MIRNIVYDRNETLLPKNLESLAIYKAFIKDNHQEDKPAVSYE